MKFKKNKKRIDPRYFLDETNGAADAKAEMQARIALHQRKAPADWYSPESETGADYKYNMEKQHNDKEALQAIKEVLELVPEFKRRIEQTSLSLILRELAAVAAKNPTILGVEPEYSDSD